MPDTELMIKTIKLSWINRLLNDSSNLNVIWHAVTGISDFKTFFTEKLDLLYFEQDMPMFYKQYWFDFYGTEPKDVNQILNESMWKTKEYWLMANQYFIWRCNIVA